MCRAMSTAGAAARVAAIWLVALTPCMTPQAALAAKATGTSAVPASEEATSSKVHELLTLLADPKIQEWLEKQDEAKAAAGAASGTADNSISHELNSDLSAIREHIVGLAAALPDLPDQFQRGSTRVTAELGHGGRTRALLLLAVFVGLGFGLEWLFRKVRQGVRARLDAPLSWIPSAIACALSPSSSPLPSGWWRYSPSAASAPFWLSIGRRCCASCCLAI